MRASIRRKVWLWLAAVALAVLPALAIWQGPRLYHTALLGSGFSAEILCGGVFVSGRDPATVKAEDLTGPGYELLRFFQTHVDAEAKNATASAFGIARQTAIFREGLGCTLIDGRTETDLRAEAVGLFSEPLPPASDALWPEGERVDLEAPLEKVDKAALDAAVAAAFAEPDPARPRNTRALVVVHNGRIVAERYAPGFAADMPLIGWSMTKAALNALIGLRIKDSKLALADENLRPEWRGEDDPRRNVSIDNLLQMSSGLAFDESYGDALADVTQMLFVAGDKAKFAASKPLIHEPGGYWEYSSGTSVILAGILRASFADQRDYLRYPRERLFAPLGMRTALIEPDAAGTFVGSSLMYASARDFARLGLLYLEDGVWQGERILPEGWVAYTLTPAKHAPEQSYGAHMWLKLPLSAGYGEPPMPDDAYYFLGHEEQTVAIVPSRDLVIVRLGRTTEGGDWDNARDLSPIAAAFPARTR
ncbi:MAG TPA: serine hydrolase [Methyloceanibacter sp.]|nr:serine hydrolase [Methyloceanibacter sp.]